MGSVLSIFACRRLRGLIGLASCCGWWSPYRHAAILQDRHECVHLQDGVLHRDGGPAIRYRDGFSVWALNGVRVPQEIAEIPASRLDPRLLYEMRNVDVRREFVRKIGIERLVYKLNASLLDKVGDYELLSLNIGGGEHRPFLKMLNPSVPECWHVEDVHPDCRTVQEALNFRNGLTKDMIDDENGADWYQQGDVILRPSGAKKFRSRPIVLT